MMRAILSALLLALGPGAAVASPADLATIESECGKRLNLPPDGCACIGAKAAKLKDGQQAFIAAALAKDKATQQSIMQNLTVAELTEAGMFHDSGAVAMRQGRIA